VPLHPEGIRERGYRYVRAFLNHQLPVAGVLRIDHMPSFHRVFWIAPGMEASDGVYVRYPADELYAVFCLESQRHRTMLVGEDLGTVPPEVPAAMDRHNVHRMYVVQYELKTDPGTALPTPLAASAASINTHDMPPFAAYWEGRDIDERRALGLLRQEQSHDEQTARRAFRDALLSFLRAEGRIGEQSDTQQVFRACLGHLRDGPARLLLITLEDLWQETVGQNVPSTVEECPNWRRKARLALEQFWEAPEVLEVLQEVSRGFPPGGPNRSGKQAD
jgi:4-alpha-glucanotransferase